MHLKRLCHLGILVFMLQPLIGDWYEPSSTNKPWTRWWWHGSAVEKEELSRELEQFKAVGFGGVEITPIYGVEGAESLEREFLSEEWLDLVKHACIEARRLGLQVDIVPGTGWRLGHEGVPEEERAVSLKLEVEKEAGTKSYRAIAELSGERVKRPAPGGAGYTLDMLNRDAVRHYMEWFNRQFFSVVPPFLVRGVFHDSWEYETDWTHGMERDFKRLQGRSMEAILPVFDPEAGHYSMDTLERWRYAYRETLDELLLENFCDIWNGAIHGKGLLSRNQAHGSIANLLDVYARADIPETEIFRDEETFLIHKFASSAAHVSGKKLVSAESFTWLSEHWTSDLAKIKKFVDYMLLCGVNHIFYHGTAYSPESAPWPGWVFYASTQVNDRNPIWNHLPAVNQYITRCQGLLQSGRPYTEVCLYWPIADLYASKPGTKIRQNIDGRNWFAGSHLEKTARELWDAGIHFDYISDRQLVEHAVTGKQLPTIILPPLKRIPVATMAALDRLSSMGVEVIALNSPEVWKSPEAWEIEAADLQVRSVGQSMLKEQRISLVEALDPDRLGSDGWQANSTLRCIRRVLEDDSQLYFIANWSDQQSRAIIPLGVAACERMDPWTGVIGRIELPATGQLDLSLEAYASTFIRVGSENPATGAWPLLPTMLNSKQVEGPWRISFLEGGPELPAPIGLDQPQWISELGRPELDGFAGLVSYRSQFHLDDAELKGRVFLDLGEMSSSARVLLNGKAVATIIQEPHVVDLPVDCLVQGSNTLEIEVATLADNRIRYLDRNGYPWSIFKDINFVNIDYKPFDASDWPISNHGLKGPVRLITGN